MNKSSNQLLTSLAIVGFGFTGNQATAASFFNQFLSSYAKEESAQEVLFKDLDREYSDYSLIRYTNPVKGKDIFVSQTRHFSDVPYFNFSLGRGNTYLSELGGRHALVGTRQMAYQLVYSTRHLPLALTIGQDFLSRNIQERYSEEVSESAISREQTSIGLKIYVSKQHAVDLIYSDEELTHHPEANLESVNLSNDEIYRYGTYKVIYTGMIPLASNRSFGIDIEYLGVEQEGQVLESGHSLLEVSFSPDKYASYGFNYTQFNILSGSRGVAVIDPYKLDYGTRILTLKGRWLINHSLSTKAEFGRIYDLLTDEILGSRGSVSLSYEF